MATAEIPLAVILSLLDAPKPTELQYVLKSLYLSSSSIASASKSDLNHLTAKITNLLNARDDYKKWYGSHVIQVIALNPIILTNAGSQFLVALLKIINDEKTISLNLKNAALALNAIINGIRGKPLLTREVLTPNLPNIISALLDKLEKDVLTILPILQTLLFKNTTTFRPYVKKFESKLLHLLTENFDNLNNDLQKQVCTSYAYLNLVKPSNSQSGNGSNNQTLPDDQWRAKIFKILDELRSAVLIYDNLVDLRNESDTMKLIGQLPDAETKDYIFPFLKIDLTNPISVISISKRIRILTQLLLAFITSPTPFAIRVPLGLIIQAANLLLGVSPNYIPFKKELNSDGDLKRVILSDITKTQSYGANLILEISKIYKKVVLPHLPHILASLEVAIPIKNGGGKKLIKIDENACLAIESELLVVIKTVVELLKLFDGLTEFELINKLIDVSLLFLSKRSSLEGLLDKKQQVQNPQGTAANKNKKKKNKDSSPLSDILSHSELFILDPPKHTILTISSFFEIVLKKLNKLSPNYRIKIVKYIISSSVEQEISNIKISPYNVKLLETLVLYPSDDEVFSILPIVKRLLPNNERLSLLTNPRFPLLDIKYYPKQHQDLVDEDEDEDEDEEIAEVDSESREEVEKPVDLLEELRAKASEVIVSNPAQSNVFKTDEEIKTLSFAKEEKSNEQAELLNKTRSADEIEDGDDDNTPSKRIKITTVHSTSTSTQEVKVQIDESEDEGSDFEIPDIALSEDDEGEEE